MNEMAIYYINRTWQNTNKNIWLRKRYIYEIFMFLSRIMIYEIYFST